MKTSLKTARIMSEYGSPPGATRKVWANYSRWALLLLRLSLIMNTFSFSKPSGWRN